MKVCYCNTGPSCGDSSSVSPQSSISNSECPVSCYNGDCKQDYNSNAYICACHHGFQGIACASPVPASAPQPVSSSVNTATAPASCPVPCSMHGSCRAQYNSDGYVCLCQPGWGGSACNTALGSQVAGAQTQSGSEPATAIKGNLLQYNPIITSPQIVYNLEAMAL